MTVLKLALVNLVMWTRDHYFPDAYAHATWARLAPFFQLAGMVTPSRHIVSVELRVNGRITFRILIHIFSRISRVGRHKQHTTAAYLFLASFTTVYEQSLLRFHPMRA